MTAIQSYEDAEKDAQLLLLNDKEVNIGHMPEDFICNSFLVKPGEYCISLTEGGHTRVSVKAEDSHVHHLLVQKKGDVLKMRGLLHGSGESVGELLYNLKDPHFDVLTSVLGSQISFSRLIQLPDLRDKRVLQMKNIRNMKRVHRDNHMLHYEADADFGGKIESVAMVQAYDLPASEWRQKMFDEIRVAAMADEHSLPIRAVLAIVVEDGGYLLYKKQKGTTLDIFAQKNLANINILSRIRLMMDVVHVMAELHLAGIYHGALEPRLFFVDENPRGVLFNGAEGLAPMRIGKTVTLANFRLLAPEVAWTRRLTPSTGVYSLGRILQMLADVSADMLVNDPNAHALQNVASLTSSCLSRRSTARLTMDGVFLRLQEVFLACQAEKK